MILSAKNILKLSILGFILMLVASCKKKSESAKPCGFTDVTFASPNDDLIMGAKIDSAIRNTPSEYTVLDSNTHPLVYQELHKIKDSFLNSGQITHKSDFPWKLRVLKDDTTLNAFCTPGGYIYVYTALINYLPTLDALAGVMGHEMAHADHRHSSKAMTRDYGVTLISQILLGKNNGALINIAKNLDGLKFSRCHETEADLSSVDYMANGSSPKFQCDGTARFFEIIAADGGSRTPEFLSTHPNPDNRVKDIKDKAASLNCSTAAYDDGSRIQAIKNSLK